MGHLPAELIDHIISYLVAERRGRDDGRIANTGCCGTLAQYATVSLAWQQRVEIATFGRIILTPARLASPLVAQALTPDRLRRFVRVIDIDVLLPPYAVEARGQRETEAERAINDYFFTDTVTKVFALLAAATTDTHDRPHIRLILCARCLTDAEGLETGEQRWPGYGDPDDISSFRHERSYLSLRPTVSYRWKSVIQDDAEFLPKLPCVQEFGVRTSRHIDPRTLCLLASRMPALETVHWHISDHEKRDVAVRKRLRADFALALENLPSSLQHFELLYTRYAPLDHSFRPPSILDDEIDGDNGDKLSLALHKLSLPLVSFMVAADLGPEVVWPLE